MNTRREESGKSIPARRNSKYKEHLTGGWDSATHRSGRGGVFGLKEPDHLLAAEGERDILFRQSCRAGCPPLLGDPDSHSALHNEGRGGLQQWAKGTGCGVQDLALSVTSHGQAPLSCFTCQTGTLRSP